MTSEVISFIGAISVPVLACVSIIVGQWIGRRQGLKQAETASAEAANKAREVVTADWAEYTKLLMERLRAVEHRAGAAEKRLDSAESRAEVAEERATVWESRYRIAMTYVRDLIAWASGMGNLDPVPTPPAELRADL